MRLFFPALCRYSVTVKTRLKIVMLLVVFKEQVDGK